MPGGTTPVGTGSQWIHLELLAVVAIWAGTFVATKMVLAEISPALSALYRYLIASAAVVAIDWRNAERVAARDYPPMIFLAATGVTLYYLLQHYGIKYTNATDAAVLISLSPVFIGIISWALLGEKLRPMAAAGLALSFGGSFLVVTNGELTAAVLDERMTGNALILLTAVVWALYSVYGKKLMSSYSPRTIVKYTTVIGTVLIAPFSLAEVGDDAAYRVSWTAAANLLYLGGAASVYGYLAWYRGLARLPAVTVGSYLYFRPLLTGLIAAAVLEEKVSTAVAAGGILIVAGTYLVAKASTASRE